MGLMLVELGLSDADSFVEVIVGQGRVQDLVTVVLQVGGLQATGSGRPAVEEEDLHGNGFHFPLYPSFLA